MKKAALTYRFEKKIAPYADALRKAGVEPVFVTPDARIDSLGGIGLVLSGGQDVDPALYGAKAEAATGEPDRERDALEQRLVREALERDIAVLAICRGSQLFNVTHSGGTLWQHIEGHRIADNGTHEATIEAGTKLAKVFGPGKRQVNSRHHQAVRAAGQGLIVSARSADGIVEGLERTDRRFAVAVQWHPEDLLAQDLPLFEAFRDAL